MSLEANIATYIWKGESRDTLNAFRRFGLTIFDTHDNIRCQLAAAYRANVIPGAALGLMRHSISALTTCPYPGLGFGSAPPIPARQAGANENSSALVNIAHIREQIFREIDYPSESASGIQFSKRDTEIYSTTCSGPLPIQGRKIGARYQETEQSSPRCEPSTLRFFRRSNE